jgi:WD40 repeat protein
VSRSLPTGCGWSRARIIITQCDCEMLSPARGLCHLKVILVWSSPSCSDNRTVRLWDAVSGAHIVTLHGHSGGVKSVAFSPSVSQLASCSDDGAVRWWDATSGAPIATLKCHGDEINCIAFSPNGLRLSSCSHDRTVQLWHAVPPAHIATLEGYCGRVGSVALSPDGLWLASAQIIHNTAVECSVGRAYCNTRRTFGLGQLNSILSQRVAAGPLLL